jgi:hypothetical protein
VNPDVAQAVDMLARSGTLNPAQARLFSRIARRDLVSVHAELRLLAYLGVLLVMAGVGILLKENLDHIGPVAIAVGLGLGALLCLGWVARQAPPFSRAEIASPHLALDYVLLLGALLVGAELAYVEAQFTALGDAWPWHLLLVSVIYALLAIRYDSRVVFSLALSTFVAWRGVSAAKLEPSLWFAREAGAVRANAVACGVLFVVLGAALRARRFKAHFEPVAAHLGWLLILAASLSGVGDSHPAGTWYAVGLGALGGGLAFFAYGRRRFGLFAMGVVGAYLGISALFLHALSGSDAATLAFFWFAVTPIVVLALLYVAHRKLREPE